MWAHSVNGSTLRLHRRSGRSTRPVSTKVTRLRNSVIGDSGISSVAERPAWDREVGLSKCPSPTKFKRASIVWMPRPASVSKNVSCSCSVSNYFPQDEHQPASDTSFSFAPYRQSPRLSFAASNGLATVSLLGMPSVAFGFLCLRRYYPALSVLNVVSG